jgi:beta-lactamase superfamily II metal-dependent hydrolase
VKNGATHYTALDCWYEVNGAKRSYQLAEGITMNILYQKFYENKASEENNYSVCLLFSEGDNHYLFTGDLEKTGEASLLTNNLPKCKLYKAGHHGSKTSSTSALMAKIQPEVVCVCCCAGSSEYNAAPENTFPTQTFINNVAPYTKKIYVTSLAINDSNGKTTGFTSMNGNIVVSSMGGVLTVNCSNSNTILKETAWFKANRKWPSNGVK